MRGVGSGAREVDVWPNPATNVITVEGVGNCEVVVYDVVGCKVATAFINNKQKAIDISGLSKGVYVVEIKDTETRARTTKKIVKI